MGIETNIDFYEFNEIVQDAIRYESLFEKNYYCGDMMEKNLVSYQRGKIPVILSAPHSVRHGKKAPDIYTGCITRIIGDITGCFIIYSNKSRVDFSTWFNKYTLMIKQLIEEHKIKALIDLHGASADKEFDVDFGTGNGLYIDNSTVGEIKDIFIRNGIYKTYENHTFAASSPGSIANYTYNQLGLRSVQLEVNRKLREPSHSNIMFFKLIKSLTEIVERLADERSCEGITK